MSASPVLFKTVESVNLVFGLDWFAILGGTLTREVRRIVRQQKATHAVHAGDHAVSVGVTALSGGKRSMPLYSAAQLVARQFSTGVVALIVPLDHNQWWFVAVHEGAVIARTDYVCASLDQARERVTQLRHAYPNLTLLNDVQPEPSLSGLVEAVHADAELRRVAHGNYLVSRPYYALALFAVGVYVLHRAGLITVPFGDREPSSTVVVSAEDAWAEALRGLTSAHWVHGVAGSAGVLLSLYTMPVQLEGWRLHQAECVAQDAKWNCHADYGRADPETSNDRLLSAAWTSWDVSFTPLEQARIRWSFTSAGRAIGNTALHGAQYIERSVFSALQAIRPAFSQMNIDPPERLPVPAPVDEHGHAIPQPPGLPQYRMRAVRIQAPLRSVSLFLPHTQHIAWRRVALSFDPHVRPDLTHSRLSVTLQGVLYEQD